MNRRLSSTELRKAKLLVRVPNWVGDAVMCLPALRALRVALPNSDIVLLAKPWVRDVFPRQELHCRIILYDPASQHRGLRGRLAIAAELRQERFDAAILFQNAFDAALLSWLARIPVRAGYSRQGRRLLLTHAVSPPKKHFQLGHEAHYYLEMLRRLGIIEHYEEVKQISLPASDSQQAARGRLLAQVPAPDASQDLDVPLIGISPGASFGTAKRWPAARFADLAARLHREHRAICVFFGAPAEAGLAESVIELAGIPAVSFAGKTSLTEFMELVHGCDLFVTNDTGTMHVAAALGVPTLAIFGPTNEQETRPLGARVELAVGDAFCRPCKLRHCPIDHRCMHSISVEQALQAAQILLRAPSSAAPGAAIAARGSAPRLALEQRPPA